MTPGPPPVFPGRGRAGLFWPSSFRRSDATGSLRLRPPGYDDASCAFATPFFIFTFRVKDFTPSRKMLSHKRWHFEAPIRKSAAGRHAENHTLRLITPPHSVTSPEGFIGAPPPFFVENRPAGNRRNHASGCAVFSRSGQVSRRAERMKGLIRPLMTFFFVPWSAAAMRSGGVYLSFRTDPRLAETRRRNHS